MTDLVELPVNLACGLIGVAIGYLVATHIASGWPIIQYLVTIAVCASVGGFIGGSLVGPLVAMVIATKIRSK